MNYIKLINQFWKLRRSKRITSKQADLYFFLIQECNEKAWENPFECSNKLIIASIDMQEPTLIDARNRLKQLGLIDFKGGKRNEASPVYTLTYLNNLSRNRDESIVNTEVNLKLNDEHYTKLNGKLNETRQLVVSFLKNVRPELPSDILEQEAGKLINKRPGIQPEFDLSYINSWAQRITIPNGKTRGVVI